MRRVGSDDAADLLQASEEVAWCLPATHHPQTVRQTFGQVKVGVGRLPEVKQLQDVLPGEAGRNHSQDVLLMNFDPWQALGDHQEVVQGQVFQAVAARDFPLTVVHPWRDTVVSRSIRMRHLMPGKRRRHRTSYDAVELVLVLVPLPPQPQQL